MMKPMFLVAALAAGCGSSVGPSTFGEINTRIFTTSCAFSDSCHNAAGAHASGNLNLKDDPYGALINVLSDDPKARGEGKLRVKAGDSANSFLYIKINLPTVGGACQEPTADSMKLVDYGACMPYTSAPLTGDLIAGIKAWIDMGALKN